jgi:hypothetical protein
MKLVAIWRDILPSLTLRVQRGLRASSGSLRKNPPRTDTECPTASLHQIPAKAVLCNYFHYTPCGGYLYPDTDATGTVRGLATPHTPTS